MKRIAHLLPVALAACRTTPADDRGSVCVAISVDWEGASLDPADLAAMSELEKMLPDVPLTHFLNAAYFTKPNADAGAINAAIGSVVRDRDERGLHIHAWHSLVRSAGVEPKSEPSFLGPEAMEIDGEAGFDIELESYSAEEVEAIVRRSLELLGMKSAKSFRAGAWLAGPRVREAIRRAGFEIDSSAMYAGWLDEMQDVPLPSRVQAMWPEMSPQTQPYRIATSEGPLLEMPLTGGLADFLTAAEIEAHLAEAVDRATEERSIRFAQTGFHQEGAADFAPRVVEALQRVRDRIAFDTVSGCARRVWE